MAELDACNRRVVKRTTVGGNGSIVGRGWLLLAPLVLSIGAGIAGIAGLAWADSGGRQATLINHYNPNASKLTKGPLLSAKIRWHGNNMNRDFLAWQPYKETRRGVTALLRKHKPHRTRYIGLGRSPTVLVAFLQNLGAEAVNLPASGLRHSQVPQGPWNKHLKKVLPKNFLDGQKEVVIFDRVSSGASLKQAASALQAYAKKIGSKAKVKVRAFVSSTRHANNTQPKIDLDRYPELDAMNHYSAWAEYGSFTVGQDDFAQAKRRPQYDTFKQQLLERMIRDKTLSRLVDKINGVER